MNTDIEYYRRQFYQEARDILEGLNESVLKLEIRSEDKELINAIFRGIHTIKGSAGSFDLDDISSFSHYFENVLSLLRDGFINVTPELIDLILAGIDHLLELVAGYEKEHPVPIDDKLIERFKSIIDSINKTEIKKEPEAEKISESKEEFIPEEIISDLTNYREEGLNIYKVIIRYDSETFRNGYDPLILLKNIRASSRYYKAYTDWNGIPRISDFDPFTLYLHPTVYIATNLSKSEIINLSFDESLIEVKDISSLCEKSEEPKEDLLNEFLQELPEKIEVLESSAIEYETTGSKDALDNIFRVVHTIKGDSSYLGLSELERFTHTFESFLEKLRSGEFQRSPEYIDVVLRGIDDLKKMIDSFSSTRKIGIPSSYKLLSDYLSGKPLSIKVPKLDISDEEWNVFALQVQEYEEMLSIWMKASTDAEKVRVAKRALEGLRKLFNFFNFSLLKEDIIKALELIEEGNYTSLSAICSKIISVLKDIEEGPNKYRMTKTLEQTSKIVETPLVQETKEQGKEQQVGVLRIEERKIDQFSNLVGELIIARNTYEYLISELSINTNISQSLLKAFRDNFYLISRLTNEINQNVASLRMIPLKGVFSRFTRVVRDISRRENKKIRFITDGEDIEVDKKIADVLSEPLIHLIRNACDHGIESPEERSRSGKPEEGMVILRAFQEGTNLIVKVIDDGRGINRKKVYEKAISLGLEVPSSIDDPSIFNLIFLPGFSTKEEVSDISGRGVGMDVVRNAVTSLGGKIDVNSKEGEGTEITLTIPTSIGVTLALIVEENNDIYAIPMDYVVETMKIPVKNLRRLHDIIGFYYRGEVLPLEKLETLLKGDETRYSNVEEFLNHKGSLEEVPVVIAKTDRGKYGIVVDRFLKNMEITIKPMPDMVSNINIFDGVSISGDGRVILVVNPERLI
ncbi:chemotaxis protein CheA [bacterium]|nr:chemotaxis protein CheA [bacterium]